jgi:hypothetical protein
LLKIFFCNDISKYAILIDKILAKFDNISVKNINEICQKFIDPVLNLVIKDGDLSPYFKDWEPSHRTSMFVMKTFRSKFLLKSRDFSKDSENLSRDIFFYLYPEFNTPHYVDNLYVWNISSNLMDPIFSVYGSLFSVIDNKLLDIYSDFLDTPLSNHNIPNLEIDSDVADRYFEFLEILNRAKTKVTQNSLPKVKKDKPLEVVRKINLTNFKFY